MTKYIDVINLRSSAFQLSAASAFSATNATIASGYTFDPQIAFFDDYVGVYLNHPYRYSSQQVTSLDTSDVQSFASLSMHDMPIAVYNSNLDVIGNTNIHSYVYDTGVDGKSCLTESIAGSIQQTATETQNVVGEQWVVPVKFKVASTYMAIALARLYDGGINTVNATASDGYSTGIVNTNQHSLEHRLYQAFNYGTTIPAILFKEAGIADIPVYDADDTRYRLNTQVFDTLGNNAHVVASATSAHGFVKFAKALQNLTGGVEIEYATVKANTYSHDNIYQEIKPGNRWITVYDYSILTANVTDTQKACGVIDTTAANPLKYAFYDAYGNYKALTANNNTIYDEYTYYCVFPTSSYATSAAATAAIQTLIDNREYTNFSNVDINSAPYITYNYGTLAMDEQIFNVYDEILDFGAAYESGRKSKDHFTTLCIPFTDRFNEVEHTFTAVSVDQVDKYKNIKTYITKPQIDTAHVQHRTQSTYTYRFDSLFIVNSACTAYNTHKNNTIYKHAAFNMIQYSNPLVAPTDQCTATCFGYGQLASTYYNFCAAAYKSTRVSTQYIATAMLPIATDYSTTVDTQLETLPTRDIYYCLTMSK